MLFKKLGIKEITLTVLTCLGTDLSNLEQMLGTMFELRWDDSEITTSEEDSVTGMALAVVSGRLSTPTR